MDVKAIRLDEEAYDMLRRQRRPGETFSDAVKRLVARRPISDFAGIWKSVPEKELRRIQIFLEEGRRRDRARVEHLLARRE